MNLRIILLKTHSKYFQNKSFKRNPQLTNKLYKTKTIPIISKKLTEIN